MATAVTKQAEISTPQQQATTESHYHSKKDRIFVRGIQGQYSLKDELKRLRDMPRVRKAVDIKFRDGPQTYSRHYVEPKDGITQTFHLHMEEYGPGGPQPEARPRERGRVLHPRRRGLRDPRRHPL
jgi:hypothetical protein